MERNYFLEHVYSSKGLYCTHNYWYADSDLIDKELVGKIIQDNNSDSKSIIFEVSKEAYDSPLPSIEEVMYHDYCNNNLTLIPQRLAKEKGFCYNI